MADLETKIKITAENNTNSAIAQVNKNISDTAKATKLAGDSSLTFKSILSSLNISYVDIARSVLNYAKENLNLSAEIEGLGDNTDSLAERMQKNRTEVTLSFGAVKKLSDYLKEIKFPIPAVISFTDKLADLRIKLGVGGKKPVVFQDVVDGAKEAVAAIGVVTDAVSDYYSNEISEMQSDFATSAAMTAAVVADAAVSMSQAIELEEQFNAASRTISGTAQELSDLEDRLQDLSTDSLAVPVEQLYSVAGIAGTMGKTAQDAAGFVQQVSEAAIALQIPVESLAEKFGTVQTQLGNTDAEMTTLLDKINAVADSMAGKVSENDIFTVLSTGVATAAQNFGLMQGETVALVGSLLSLGEAPETARTAIVSLLSSLQNAKNQTPEFQAALGQLGTSADKLAVDIKAKPMETLKGLLTQMNGLSNAARLDLATKLLGSGGDSIALSKLVANVGLLNTGLGTVSDTQKFAGSVHDAYSSSIETASAKIDMLFNALKEQAASTMQPFLPLFKVVVDGLTNFVVWMKTGKDAFSGLTEILSQSIVFWAASAGAIGAVGSALSMAAQLYSVLNSRIGFYATKIYDAVLLTRAFAVAQWENVLALLAHGDGTRRANVFTMLWGQGLTGLRNALIAAKSAVVGFLGPIGLWGIAITTAVTSFFYLIDKTVEFGGQTVKVSEIIKAALSVIADQFISAFNTIKGGVEILLASKFFKVATWFGIAAGISTTITMMGGLSAAIATVAAVITGAIAPALAVLTPLLAFVMTPVGLLVAGFVLMTAVVEGFIYKATGEFASFEDLMTSLGAGIAGSINSIIGGFALLTGSIQHFGIVAGLYWDNFLGKISDSELEKKLAAEAEMFTGFANEMAQKDFVGEFKTEIEQKLTKKTVESAPDKRGKDTGGAATAATDGKEAKAQADAKKKALDEENKALKEALTEKARLIKDSEDTAIREIERSGKTQQEIDDAVFAEKLKSQKAMADELAYQMLDQKTKLENISKIAVTESNGTTSFVDFEEQGKKQLATIEIKQKLIDAAKKGDNAPLAKIADDQAALEAEKKLINDGLIAKRAGIAEELTARKAALTEIETATRTNVQNLIAIEKEHHDKAVAAQNEIANLHKTGAEKLREIERAGMTDAQLKADKELEITQKTAQVKELIKKGEFAKAAEEGKKLQDLTATAAMDANSQVKTGELPWYEGALAADKYKESLTLTEQALQGVSTAEQEKEEAAAMQRAEQEIKLRETKGVIDAINTALASKKMLEIVADTKAIDAVKTAIDTIPNVKRIKIEFGENGVPSFSEAASVTNKAVANNKTGVTSDSEKILGRYVISMGDAGNINAIADKAADVTLEKLKKYNRTAT